MVVAEIPWDYVFMGMEQDAAKKSGALDEQNRVRPEGGFRREPQGSRGLLQTKALQQSPEAGIGAQGIEHMLGSEEDHDRSMLIAGLGKRGHRLVVPAQALVGARQVE